VKERAGQIIVTVIALLVVALFLGAGRQLSNGQSDNADKIQVVQGKVDVVESRVEYIERTRFDKLDGVELRTILSKPNPQILERLDRADSRVERLDEKLDKLRDVVGQIAEGVARLEK